MYFLSHKHNNVCVVMGEPYTPDTRKNPVLKDGITHTHTKNCIFLPEKMSKIPNSHLEVSLRWIEKENDEDGYISVPKPEKKFWDNFNRCLQSKKQFIVLPFGFNCLDSGHQNYLLYDTNKHTLQRFETFGDADTECLSNENIDECIDDLFRKNVKNFNRYIKPLEFLPKNSFQTIQEDEKEMNENDPIGFCSVWSIWLIDLCLSNPQVPIKDLVKIAMTCLKQKKKIDGYSFTSFIRDYSIDLVKVGKIIEENLKSTLSNEDGWKNNNSVENDGMKRNSRRIKRRRINRRSIRKSIRSNRRSRKKSMRSRKKIRRSKSLKKNMRSGDKFDGSTDDSFPAELENLENSIQSATFSNENNIYFSKDFENLLQHFQKIIDTDVNIPQEKKDSVLKLAIYYWKIADILKDVNECRKHLMKKENLNYLITRETYIKKWKLYQSPEYINKFIEKIRLDVNSHNHKITRSFDNFLKNFPERLRQHMLSLKCH